MVKPKNDQCESETTLADTKLSEIQFVIDVAVFPTRSIGEESDLPHITESSKITVRPVEAKVL